MKKIFILTGEPSGDKLASKVILRLKKLRDDIDYLSVGGEKLGTLNIKTLYDLKEITYIGFTKVFLNIFKIKNKINYTAKEILKFNPDVLFTVDSPDFTLRVAEIVKKKNEKIKVAHFVAPQVWVWRPNRVKKMKKYIDHIYLLFNFEKKYFEKENINCEFVGHPLLEEDYQIKKVDVNQIIGKNKAIISLFSGSRKSEILSLTPILLDFIRLMNKKYDDFIFVFHSLHEHVNLIKDLTYGQNITNIEIISDEIIKNHILEKSVFAIAKSGTISLEISKKKIPSVIIYKMNIINYLIVKSLVKVKYANIINISADKMIIPELIQGKCNSKNIYNEVCKFIENPSLIKDQIINVEKTLKNFNTIEPPSEIVAKSLNKFISF